MNDSVQIKTKKNVFPVETTDFRYCSLISIRKLESLAELNNAEGFGHQKCNL